MGMSDVGIKLSQAITVSHVRSHCDNTVRKTDHVTMLYLHFKMFKSQYFKWLAKPFVAWQPTFFRVCKSHFLDFASFLGCPHQNVKSGSLCIHNQFMNKKVPPPATNFIWVSLLHFMLQISHFCSLYVHIFSNLSNNIFLSLCYSDLTKHFKTTCQFH
jgi:hypothetical protein